MQTRSDGTGAYRVLLVSADEASRTRLRALLDRSALLVTCDIEVDPDRGVERAARGDHDCLLVDHEIGAVSGVALVAAVRARGGMIPVVLVSDAPDAEVDQVAGIAGVTDVIGSEELNASRLARRVRFAVRVGRAEADATRMLARAQAASRARDELLAVVSHDLRSPLNAIVLACDALDADISDAERHRYVAAVRRAGQRAERLLRDLLDVSRIESGGLRIETRPISAKALLEQTRADHEILARDAGSELRVELDGEPGQVLADRDRVLQVLANLVGNALKHAAGSAITLSAQADGDGVVLTVADRGPGINPEQLPHVFDRFWQGRTKRRGGAGLGLAIAKGIIDAHGGTLSAASEPGQGARFSVRLPRPA